MFKAMILGAAGVAVLACDSREAVPLAGVDAVVMVGAAVLSNALPCAPGGYSMSGEDELDLYNEVQQTCGDTPEIRIPWAARSALELPRVEVDGRTLSYNYDARARTLRIPGVAAQLTIYEDGLAPLELRRARSQTSREK